MFAKFVSKQTLYPNFTFKGNTHLLAALYLELTISPETPGCPRSPASPTGPYNTFNQMLLPQLTKPSLCNNKMVIY